MKDVEEVEEEVMSTESMLALPFPVANLETDLLFYVNSGSGEVAQCG